MEQKDLAVFIQKQYQRAAALAPQLPNSEALKQLQTHVSAAEHAIEMMKGFGSTRMQAVVKE